MTASWIKSGRTSTIRSIITPSGCTKPTTKPEDRTNTSDGFRDLSNFFTGSPQKVLDEIKAFEAESGIDELVLFFHFPGMDRAVSRGSMQRFAADVLPHLG